MAYNNELPTYESLLEFQEVYLRAVALAWRDPHFHDEFLKEPLLAMGKWLGYNCPWSINLVVREPSSADAGWNPDKRKWHLPQNGIRVGLPEKPANDADQPLALAAYNDSGPTYLFTCC